MANLISAGNFNLLDSNAWRLADTGGVQLGDGSLNFLTTGNTTTPTFTLTNTKVNDGVVLMVNRQNTTGTMTVELFNGTSVVATCTVNTSALPAGRAFVFFKWASPYTSTGLSTMSIRARVSSTFSVSAQGNNGSGDLFKLLRLSSADVATAAAGDTLSVVGELDSSSTLTSYTVTMNNTAATVWGRTMVGYGGLVNWGTAASTNYLYKLNSNLDLYGGEWRMGSLASPIPDSSVAELFFANASSEDFGIRKGGPGQLNGYGSFKTLYVMLAADASASATSITLSQVPTNWKNTETVALMPTTRNSASLDKKALSADVTTTTASLAALTAAHSGTGATAGEVVNMNRNVKIHGTSAALAAVGGGIDNLVNAELYFISGVSITGTCSGIVIHDVSTASSSYAASVSGGTLDASAVLNESNASNTGGTQNSNGAGGSITNNVIATVARGDGILVTNSVGAGVTVTGNRVGSASGFGMRLFPDNGLLVTCNNNVVHNTGGGVGVGQATGNAYSVNNLTISNLTAWRTRGPGVSFTTASNVSGGTAGHVQNFTLDTATLFGNQTAGIQFGTPVSNSRFKSVTMNAGVTDTQPIGIQIGSTTGLPMLANVVFDSVDMGVTQTHATADLQITNTGDNRYAYILAKFRNCRFASPTEISGQTLMGEASLISSQKHDATANNHRSWSTYGTLSIDTTIAGAASPSARMTPNSATNKYVYPRAKQIAVPSGSPMTVSVKVRKSVSGDGSAYNGAQPRLILKANASMGIANDVVLATATNAANGAFQIISGTTPSVTDNGALEFVVDCDGTAGWINVDDWGPA